MIDLIFLPPGPIRSRILSVRNFQLVEARSVRGNLRACVAERLVHGVEDFERAFFAWARASRIMRNRDADDLDVHLQRGDTGARAGNFEVHVAVVIFGAGDVGEDRILVVIADHQAHGDTSASRLERTPASISASEPPQTVAIEDDPLDSRMSETRRMAYGKSASGGSRLTSARSRKRAVADFAAARAAQELHFANAERREVVVQHEALELVLLEEQVEPLHVFLGAERQRRQSLRFAASKQRRAVYARQQADFAGDLANLVESASIRTAACVQNVVAENVLAHAFKRALGQGTLSSISFFLREWP